MGWTIPRTWTTNELVTAAMLNEQIRDNENWLKDQFSTVSGHDHDGVDSKQIPWANMPQATFVTWISGAMAVQTSAQNQSARPHPNGYTEGPYVDSTDMLFAFPIPYAWAGQVVHVKEIVFYGYTSNNAYYFDAIYLRRSDLDGTYTDDVTYTIDLGNGSTGDLNATIFSGDLALSDFPYMLVVDVAGGGSYANLRVYGFRVTWEV